MQKKTTTENRKNAVSKKYTKLRVLKFLGSVKRAVDEIRVSDKSLGRTVPDHISPVLHQLHWLTVRKRVDFKVSSLVYRSLSGTEPSYLATDCQVVSGDARRRLRSANSRMSVIRRTYSQFSDRC